MTSFDSCGSVKIYSANNLGTLGPMVLASLEQLHFFLGGGGEFDVTTDIIPGTASVIGLRPIIVLMTVDVRYRSFFKG